MVHVIEEGTYIRIVHSESSLPVIAIYYHKSNGLSLTTILTHRDWLFWHLPICLLNNPHIFSHRSLFMSIIRQRDM